MQTISASGPLGGRDPWPAGDLAGALPPTRPPPMHLPHAFDLVQANPVPRPRSRSWTPTLTCRLLGQSGMQELLFLSGPAQGWKHDAPPILTAYALGPVPSGLRR